MVTGLTTGTNYTFTLTATNAVGTSVASIPSNAISPINTLPIANGDNVPIPQYTAALITLSGSDSDGQSLTFSTVSQPANGYIGAITIVDESSSTVVYARSLGFTGADTFTYVADDGYDNSAIEQA